MMLKSIIFYFVFLFSPLSYAVVAGGIVSVQHSWPDNSEFNKLSFFNRLLMMVEQNLITIGRIFGLH